MHIYSVKYTFLESKNDITLLYFIEITNSNLNQ